MPYIESEVIVQAKQMDILTYLQNYEPQELVHVSGNIYSTRTHDSMRISGGKWCWWSRSIETAALLRVILLLVVMCGLSFYWANHRLKKETSL